jgi:hypothetical protein
MAVMMTNSPMMTMILMSVMMTNSPMMTMINHHGCHDE